MQEEKPILNRFALELKFSKQIVMFIQVALALASPETIQFQLARPPMCIFQLYLKILYPQLGRIYILLMEPLMKSVQAWKAEEQQLLVEAPPPVEVQHATTK